MEILRFRENIMSVVTVSALLVAPFYTSSIPSFPQNNQPWCLMDFFFFLQTPASNVIPLSPTLTSFVPVFGWVIFLWLLFVLQTFMFMLARNSDVCVVELVAILFPASR